MHGREPFTARLRRGIEIQGFNQIKKMRHITLQNKLFFSENKSLVLGAI